MISGIVFKNDNETIINESSKEKYNLDDLPIPNRELADLEDYIDIRSILSGRGCINQCNFCPTHNYWGSWREKRAENVVKEIEYLIHNYNTKKNNEITILARNKTYENLKNNGLIIKHKLKGKTVDHFNAILPLVFACYKVNGNLKLLKNDKEYY